MHSSCQSPGWSLRALMLHPTPTTPRHSLSQTSPGQVDNASTSRPKAAGGRSPLRRPGRSPSPRGKGGVPVVAVPDPRGGGTRPPRPVTSTRMSATPFHRSTLSRSGPPPKCGRPGSGSPTRSADAGARPAPRSTQRKQQRQLTRRFPPHLPKRHPWPPCAPSRTSVPRTPG